MYLDRGFVYINKKRMIRDFSEFFLLMIIVCKFSDEIVYGKLDVSKFAVLL